MKVKALLLGFLFCISFVITSSAQVVVDTENSCTTKGHSTWWGFDCDGSGSTVCYVKCPKSKTISQL